jgi:FkbM family methyltransferase
MALPIERAAEQLPRDFRTRTKELAHRMLTSYVRSFPVNKGKSRVVSLLWKPLSFGRYVRETRLRQANVRVRCDISRLVQRQLYFFGAYEEENCDWWVRMAKQARTVFDVGANVGLYSLLAAAVNPQAAIHAFEPTGEVFDRFVVNFGLNNFSNIVPNRVAVGRTSGKCYLHLCAGSDGSNEGMNYVSSENASRSDTAVEVVSVDDYCRTRGIDSIDLLKLDIEGGEFEALLGAERLLTKKAIGCIFVELTEWAAKRNGHSTRDIKGLLADAGYRLYLLQEGSRLRTVDSESTHNGDNAIAFAHQPALN